MSRPFIIRKIHELEALFAANRNNHSVLQQLRGELEYRKTGRAAKLRYDVERALNSKLPTEGERAHAETLRAEAETRRADAEARARALAEKKRLLELEERLRKIEKSPDNSKTGSTLLPNQPFPEPQKARSSGVDFSAPARGMHFTSPEPREVPGGQEVTRILDTWTALEVLSPQAFRRPEDLVAGESARIARFGETALPWEAGGSGRPKKRLWYQVVLGELQLGPAYAALLERYADDAPDRPAGQPNGLLAVVVCNSRGVPQRDGLTISAFGWALPIALAGDLGLLNHWRTEEKRLKDALGDRLVSTDTEGKPLPLSRESLRSAHEWLVKELGIVRELVRAPSFAVREYQPLFIRDSPKPLLLNSFFLGDLKRARDLVVQGKAPRALQRYLGSLRPAETRDLLRDPTLLMQLLAPGTTPPGRWPGKGRQPLVALQQAAVNAAISSAAGSVVAVNGPPGTGKTTLLRDIVAAVITSRAEVLASFDSPERAFTRSGVTFTRSQAKFELRTLASQLRGFELVVASSNNRAVENVSAELPVIDSVAQDLPDLRYFSSIATALRGESCWGLVAAVLGNASNIYKFQKTFWGDEDRGLESYLATAAGTPRLIPDATGSLRPPHVVVHEKAPSGPAEASARWKTARQRFVHALKASRAAIDALQHVHETEVEVSKRQEEIGRLNNARSDAEDQRGSLQSELEAAAAVARASQEASALSQAEHRLHAAARPNLFSRIFQTRPARSWREREKTLRSYVDQAASTAQRDADAQLKAETSLRELSQKVAGFNARITLETGLLDAMERELACAVSSLRAPTGGLLISAPHAERHQTTAWFDSAAQRLRDEVFVAAVQLHKAFVDAAAEPLRHNIAGLVRHLWTGVPGASSELIRDLWASFGLVVPVVSSTFASFERMFGDLGTSSVGWLLLDEAGQATPQAAVGAILRADRVVVVGDPMQVEPVVTLPQSLTHNICNHFGVSRSDYAAPSASAQTLADRASPFVATFEVRAGTRRVGLPLLTHRRCADPMFGISNAVAYENLMVKATPQRESPIGRVLGPSRWLDVAGTASSHWCPEEGELLLRLLLALAKAQVVPDLYVISPFRAVAQQARELVRKLSSLALAKNLIDFANERVGTVHTVQGREAEAVIFVLGAPEERQQGARQWAGSTPNLLNVAVTRAKERLYVIGNRSLWRSAGCFAVLAERLPSEERAVTR